MKRNNKAHHQTSPFWVRPPVGIHVTYSSDYTTTPVRKQNRMLYPEKRIIMRQKYCSCHVIKWNQRRPSFWWIIHFKSHFESCPNCHWIGDAFDIFLVGYDKICMTCPAVQHWTEHVTKLFLSKHMLYQVCLKVSRNQ